MLFRLLIIGGLFALIAWGVWRIWRDWSGEFKAIDKVKRERNLRERARPDVITLKRDEDGKYRPDE